MEKNNPTTEQVEVSEDIIAKARANKKAIIWCSVGAFAIIIGVLVWLLVAQAGSRNADELVAKADAATNDSIAALLYTEAANAGYKSGHRAAAQLAVMYYEAGKYEDAIKCLDKADLDTKVAAAGVYSLKGDCYANLDNFSEAISCYNKAISKADNNPEIVPMLLVKEANIYRAQEDYAKEAECYKTIVDEYPSYSMETRTDIKKYYERAAAQAQAK